MTPPPYLLWLVFPLFLAWSSAAYWAGDHNRNNAWLAKQAETEQQARLDYASEVVRGQVAASQSISEQQKLQANYSQLEGKFNELVHRGPLVVYKNKAPVVTQLALADVPLGSQAEQIMNALAAQPYAQVAGLINKLQGQAVGQMQAAQAQEDAARAAQAKAAPAAPAGPARAPGGRKTAVAKAVKALATALVPGASEGAGAPPKA